MKRWFAGLGMLVIFLLAASAQEKKYGLYAVGFYNLENLFDNDCGSIPRCSAS